MLLRLLSLPRYTQALDANPKAYDVYTNRAAAYAALKMWDEALADAEAAVKLNPAWLKVSRKKEDGSGWTGAARDPFEPTGAPGKAFLRP